MSLDHGPYVAYDNDTLLSVASGFSGITLRIAISRMDANGSVVNSAVLIPPLTNIDGSILSAGVRDLAVTNDGKVLVSFYVYYNPTPDSQWMWIARLNSNLSLDLTWNPAGNGTGAKGYWGIGISVSPVAPPLPLSVLYDGTVGISYRGISTEVFGKIAPDGSNLSTTFSFTLETVYATLAQPDGKFLVASLSGTGIRLWRRLNTLDAATDFGFGGGTGNVTWTQGLLSGVPTNICIDASGRIYVGIRFTGNDSFGVVRFLSDGTLDMTFGSNGLATGSSNKAGVGLTMLNSQGLVAIGSTPAGSGTNAIGFGSTGTAGTLFAPTLGAIGAWNSICTGVDGAVFVASISGNSIFVTKVGTSNGGAMPAPTFTHPTGGQIAVGQPFDGNTMGAATIVALAISGNPTEWGQSNSSTGGWSLPNSLTVGPTVYTLNLASIWVGRRLNRNISTTAAVVICLHGDSVISMADGGKKSLKDIERGDVILGADGKGHTVSKLAECWLKDPSIDTNPRAVVVERGGFGGGIPTQRFIVDIGHPVGTVQDYRSGGLQGLRPLAEILATLPPSRENLFAVVPWEKVHEWTGEENQVQKRYDIILEDGPTAYIANGLAVRSRDTDKVAGYVHDPEQLEGVEYS